MTNIDIKNNILDIFYKEKDYSKTKNKIEKYLSNNKYIDGYCMMTSSTINSDIIIQLNDGNYVIAITKKHYLLKNRKNKLKSMLKLKYFDYLCNWLYSFKYILK